MKAKYILSSVLAAAMALSMSSCVNDLDISSIDPKTSPSFDQNAVFVKAYALLGTTGQAGPAGTPDLDGQDEGESGFYRTVFNCQELSTDECLWAWQSDVDIPQFTAIGWNSSSQRTEWVYFRLGINITQLNFFLDQTEGKDDAESLRQRAEVRFLRALHYYYFLDLFGKAPFKEHFSNDLPVEKAGKDLYDYIQKELTECEADMYAPRQAPFGRADQAANWLLRARLYLNAGVYTGTPDWSNAEAYATKVIGSGYQLCDNYQELFMADNDENANAMREIIFPIRQDGAKTQSYSGANYLVSGTRGSGMPRNGTTNPWSCIFSRAALVQKFFPNLDDVPLPPSTAEALKNSPDAEIDAADAGYGTRTVDLVAKAGDDRALFYSGVGGGIRGILAEDITGFTNGLSIVKWSNIRSDGGTTHHSEYPDTDIPLFRLAEAYLIRAEARFRLGGDAAADLNVLRGRAKAKKFQGVTERDLIDEWCREFYLEARRRSDLIRFGMYTTNKYIWDWKGGVLNGTPVASYYNLYPIPAADLNNNPNLKQNPGY